MSIVSETTKAIRVTLVIWVLTAIIYPFVTIAIAQVAFLFKLTVVSSKMLKDKSWVRL